MGDPVNRVDPTGHFPALAALISGIVLSAAGAGAIATAAGLKDSNGTLGTVLTVVGSISLMAGVGAFATTGFKLKQMRAKIKTGKKDAEDLALAILARKESSARHADVLKGHLAPPDSADLFRMKLVEAEVLKIGPLEYYYSGFIDQGMLSKIRSKYVSDSVLLDTVTKSSEDFLALTRIKDGKTLGTTAYAIREIT